MASKTHLLSLAALAAVLGVLILGTARPAESGAQSQSSLESQLNRAHARERNLTADAATFARLAAQISADIAVLQGRVDSVQSDLDAARALLIRTRNELRAERAHLAALRARLFRARRSLSAWLVASYEDGQPDIVTVVLDSNGFADLIERVDFLRRVQSEEARVIRNVRDARAQSTQAAHELARLTVRRQGIATAFLRRRDALAGIEAALTAKRDAFARARAARLAALHSSQSSSHRLRSQLDHLLKAQSAGTSHLGPGGPWAIPWAIVQCESGGQNVPPNSAGASGYYQIIPPTWKGFGGSGPAAWLTSKAEQDRVATRIWNGGKGAVNWDCARIVHYGGL